MQGCPLDRRKSRLAGGCRSLLTLQHQCARHAATPACILAPATATHPPMSERRSGQSVTLASREASSQAPCLAAAHGVPKGRPNQRSIARPRGPWGKEQCRGRAGWLAAVLALAELVRQHAHPTKRRLCCGDQTATLVDTPNLPAPPWAHTRTQLERQTWAVCTTGMGGAGEGGGQPSAGRHESGPICRHSWCKCGA